MLAQTVRSLWAEPCAADAPPRVWRDWLLVGVLVPTALLEGTLRSDVMWRPAAIVLALGVVATLLWRRTHPLRATTAAFGAIIAFDVALLATGADEAAGLYTTACVILHPYALLRWGSGREVGPGLAVALVAGGLGTVLEYTGVVDTVLGFLFLFFWPVLGAAVRYRSVGRVREADQVKLREREQLARELHDTVAHHVSAIAIRAQAGRLAAGSDPEAALDALLVIEGEASRTLEEMRTIVYALRDGDDAAMGPQRGLNDIPSLARSSGGLLPVDIELSGDLDDVAPALGAALYRLAQESVTNAMRHARSASRITVAVNGEPNCVRLTVRDDGRTTSSSRGPSGYGLAGMTERATLLGGTLQAGPDASRGWLVSAVLPRVAGPR